MKRNGKILISLLSSAFVFLAAAGFGAGRSAFSEDISRTEAQTAGGAQWSEADIAAEYEYGASFSVPARTLSVGGKTYDAQSVLVYPDGNATSAVRAELGMSGVYTIIYTAEAEGRMYREEATFCVLDNFVNHGEGSSAEYGRYDYRAYAVPTSYSDPEKLYDYAEIGTIVTQPKDGLYVRLAEGDELSFTPVIDLSELTVNDPLFEAWIMPDVLGEADFEKLYITLTDAFYPEKFIRFSVRGSMDGLMYPYSYWQMGGDGQMMKGYEVSKDLVHVEDEWGKGTQTSFYGVYVQNQTVTEGAMSIDLRYAPDELAGYAVSTAAAGPELIIDLDDPKFYSDPWTGFPSGKVRISVSADMYNKDSANFLITDIFGMGLTEEKAPDTAAPEITTDTDYDVMPEGKVGGSYPVPEASAYDDVDGDVDVSVSVWYNYSTKNAVRIDSDGKSFEIGRGGDYAIVYTAKDRSGNVAEKLLRVHAGAGISPLEVRIDENRVTQAAIGEWVPFASAETSGGSGDVKVTITAACGDDVVTAEDGFRPQREGSYTISYIAVDYIGESVTQTYTLAVARGTEPIFTEEAVLPDVFVAGSAYTLPVLYADDYTSGELVRVAADFDVEDGAGKRTVKAGESFVPTVTENGGVVKLTYRAGTAEKVYEVPAVLPYVEENGRVRFRIENYFLTDGVSTAKTDDWLLFTAETPDGGWTFAHTLAAEGLEAVLESTGGGGKFGGIRIVLRDAVDKNIAVEGLLVDDGGLKFKVGSLSVSVGGEFTSAEEYAVFWSDGRFGVNGAGVAVTKTASGGAFSGFPSGRVMLGVSFVEAEEEAQLALSELSGQPIYALSADKTKPKIIISGTYGGSAAFGQTVVLPSAMAADTLDPEVDFRMSVTGPDGAPIADAEGTLLKDVDPTREYSFVAERYGKYTVRYSAEDTSGNEQTLQYAINVEDDVPPEILFSGEFATEAKVGDVLVIPEFSVSDNLGGEVTVYKYCYTSNGVLVTIPENSNSIKCRYEGVYEFRIIAIDDTGNIAVKTARIVVSA